jgi:hypothetical protein
VSHLTSEDASRVRPERGATLKDALERHVAMDAPSDYEAEMAKIPRVRAWVSALVIGGALAVLWSAVFLLARVVRQALS